MAFSRPDPKKTLSSSAHLERFNAFYAAYEADVADDLPSTPADANKRAKDLIDILPQRLQIQPEDASRWIGLTFHAARKRMDVLHGSGNYGIEQVYEHVRWHIKRASGIGGSELGIIQKHARGKRGNFGTIRDIVRSKLLIDAPTPPNEHMERGIRGEDDIRAMYLQRNGLKTHEAAMKAVGTGIWDKAPHLTFNPDEVLTHPKGEKHVIIGDYKIPSEAVNAKYENKGVEDEYIDQVTGYALKATIEGYQVEELRIVTWKDKAWDFVEYSADFDVDRAKEIVRNSNAVWMDFVMQGVVPEAPAKEVIICENDDLARMGLRLMAMKVMSSTLSSRVDDLTELMVRGTDGELGSKTGSVPLHLGEIRRVPKYDDAILLQIAEENGIDLDGFRNTTNNVDYAAIAAIVPEVFDTIQREDMEGDAKLERIQSLVEGASKSPPVERPVDMKKLQAEMEANNFDLSRANVGYQTGTYLSMKRSGPIADRVNWLKGQAQSVVTMVEDAMRTNADELVLDRTLTEITQTFCTGDFEKALNSGECIAAYSEKVVSDYEAELQRQAAAEKAAREKEKAEEKARKEAERARVREEKKKAQEAKKAATAARKRQERLDKMTPEKREAFLKKEREDLLESMTPEDREAFLKKEAAEEVAKVAQQEAGEAPSVEDAPATDNDEFEIVM